MEYAYEITKGCVQPFRSYETWGGNWVNLGTYDTGTNFCSFPLVFFLKYNLL
jgi:hypothetical protein